MRKISQRCGVIDPEEMFGRDCNSPFLFLRTESPPSCQWLLRQLEELEELHVLGAGDAGRGLVVVGLSGAFVVIEDPFFEDDYESHAILTKSVDIQIVGSVLMVAVIIGKWRGLKALEVTMRRFYRDFATSHGVLDYYMQRRPTIVSGIENIYKVTCERMLGIFSPNVRSLLVGRQTDGDGAAALTQREIGLVRGTCEHQLDDEILYVERGMGLIATIVALEPMLGLLGTVWGVLDAFAEMGTAGSANLATIAPSISAALVTTVVGLLVAIPGMMFSNHMNGQIRKITSDMEGFADELMGRVACEFQGKGA